MKKNLLQAYRQAPWRVQLQWIGLLLVVIVLIAAVSGFYLNISARAAAAGRQIQKTELKISELRQEINDLNTKFALLTSSQEMYSRIEKSSFSLLDPDNALYIEVPGYQSKNGIVLAPSPSADRVPKQIIQPEYTNSLWDWFLKNIWVSENSTSREVNQP